MISARKSALKASGITNWANKNQTVWIIVSVWSLIHLIRRLIRSMRTFRGLKRCENKEKNIEKGSVI